MLSTFGDESSDGAKQRVYAVAGLVGMEEEWDELEIKWMKRTGGKVFHAAACESDAGEFARISHKENLKLYEDLTRLIVDTKILGFGVGIDLAGFNETFPDVLPDQPYYMCFVRVVIDCADVAYLSVPRQSVKFTFDHKLETEHHAAAVYNYMVNLPEWGLHSVLHREIGFADRRSRVPIQAADLLARETMKHLDNQIGPERRRMRRSIAALNETGRFRFTYHMREYFEDLKRKMVHLEGLTGVKESEYAAWLSRHRRLDNNTNRLQYLIEFEADERQGKKS